MKKYAYQSSIFINHFLYINNLYTLQILMLKLKLADYRYVVSLNNPLLYTINF